VTAEWAPVVDIHATDKEYLIAKSDVAKPGPISSVGVSSLRRCVVCGGVDSELICEVCAARIRGEAIEQKLDQERRKPLPR
jgi:hypothetical protein